MNNTNKIILSIVLLILVLGLGVVAYRFIFGENNLNPIGEITPTLTTTPTITTSPTSTEPEFTRLISQNGVEFQIFSPESFDQLSSPIVIEGEVAGSWFFEGSFPIELISDTGTQIAATTAQTSENWMTEDFVSFRGELNFNISDPTNAQLIFRKDNPSGLPENSDEAVIDTILIPANNENTMTLDVFFKNDSLGAGSEDCSATVAVDREVPQTQAVARAAIEELLKGPSSSETNSGYYTSIPAGTTLESISIENSVITANFSEELNTAAGSCLVSAIRGQIESTLSQFNTVSEVQICVAGECEAVLQP